MQIAIRRVTEAGAAVVDQAVYLGSDTGSSLRRVDCTYSYNTAAFGLGVGTYEVSILIDGRIVGSATFTLARSVLLEALLPAIYRRNRCWMKEGGFLMRLPCASTA